MSGFLQAHTPEWVEYFTRQGYPDVEPLGAGVEGTIYRLGAGMGAKVWGRRRERELRAHVPDFDRRYARVLENLAALDRSAWCVGALSEIASRYRSVRAWRPGMSRIERRVRNMINPYSTAFARWWCHSGRYMRLVRMIGAARCVPAGPATPGANGDALEACGLHLPTSSMAARRAAVDAVLAMAPPGEEDAGQR